MTAEGVAVASAAPAPAAGAALPGVIYTLPSLKPKAVGAGALPPLPMPAVGATPTRWTLSRDAAAAVARLADGDLVGPAWVRPEGLGALADALFVDLPAPSKVR